MDDNTHTMPFSLYSDPIIVDNNIPTMSVATAENSLSPSRPDDNSALDSMTPIVDKVFNHITSIPKENNEFFKNSVEERVANHGSPPKKKKPRHTYYGSIPGIEVGTCWQFRRQVSKAGVHTPLVAGIHGAGGTGAVSIVVSGVYSNDKDYGDEFFYSGCGGKENYQGKRFSPQITDQKLTAYNLSLAVCCNANINDKEGAEAVDWQGGRPVRVIRSSKLRSGFAPVEGYRYDGIYKVVRYFPIRGATGFLVWQYLMRRDDPAPAPWTGEGIERIGQLNLSKMIREQRVDVSEAENVDLQEKIRKRKKRSILKEARRRYDSNSDSDSDSNSDPTFRNISTACISYHGERWYPTRNRVILPSHEAPPAPHTSSMYDYDNDIKPDLVELTRETMDDSPWTSNMAHNVTPVHDPYMFCDEEDMKPDISLLQAMLIHQPASPRYGANGLAGCVSPMSVTPTFTSSYMDDEDVKPDINELNKMIERNNATLPSNISPEKPREAAAVPELTNGGVYKSGGFVPLQPMDVSTLKITMTSSKATNDRSYSHPVNTVEPHKHEYGSDDSRLPLKKRMSSKESQFSAELMSPMILKISKVSSMAESEDRIPLSLHSTNILNPIQVNNNYINTPLFKLPTKLQNLIENDPLNKSLWDSLITSKTKQEFMNRLKIVFSCPCCNRIGGKLVTTPCSHNICRDCMHDHFMKSDFSCPQCYMLLGQDFLSSHSCNTNLKEILQMLIPDCNLDIS